MVRHARWMGHPVVWINVMSLIEIDQYVSARFLLDAIVEFGRRETNPVLEILEGSVPSAEHRYPPEGLAFGQGNWRAFYHSHETPDAAPGEHGHFHIFARFDNSTDEWCHVAGLVIDREGQPIQWFAANHWVVRGAWHDADYMRHHMPHLDLHDEEMGVGRWLSALIGSYRDDIEEVLQSRDRKLQDLARSRDRADVLSDRNIWKLARSKIDLQNKLEEILSPKTDAA